MLTVTTLHLEAVKQCPQQLSLSSRAEQQQRELCRSWHIYRMQQQIVEECRVLMYKLT